MHRCRPLRLHLCDNKTGSHIFSLMWKLILRFQIHFRMLQNGQNVTYFAFNKAICKIAIRRHFVSPNWPVFISSERRDQIKTYPARVPKHVVEANFCSCSPYKNVSSTPHCVLSDIIRVRRIILHTNVKHFLFILGCHHALEVNCVHSIASCVLENADFRRTNTRRYGCLKLLIVTEPDWTLFLNSPRHRSR